MATYPVINKETGEQKELSMSMTAYGEWRDKLVNRNPGWGEVLKNAEKAGGISGRLARKGSYESSTQSAIEPTE